MCILEEFGKVITYRPTYYAHMRQPQARVVWLLILVYAFSVASYASSPSLVGLDGEQYHTSVGTETKISVSAYPDGVSNALTLEVPESEAVTGLDLTIEPSVLHSNEIISWSGSTDWNATGTTLDRINVNQSDLQMLPKKWEWDFETGPSNSPQGWSLQSAGGWSWGYDSSLGQSGGVHSGTKAIYTYNGNYPNGMSTTYWATSPTIDCSGCSGTWNLKYWKRLGVEYHYYDHAYVQVKNPQGSWVQIYSSSGTINDGSFQLVTHNIGNYVQGNSAFQVRFGLGTTDGSVTYTGWNIDDVSIEPASGGGGADFANWTSAPFGPSITGSNSMIPGGYGVMSIDAEIPNNAILRTTILDGRSNTPIPGFINRQEMHLDLGPIDSEMYPELRVKLYFATPNGAQTPLVHGIHLNGRIATTLESSPTDMGWDLSGANWDGDSITGGVITTPLYTSARPISQISSNFVISGSSTTEISIDGGTWTTFSNSGNTILSSWAETVQFKFSGTNFDLTSFQADLIYGRIGDDVNIDINGDGQPEWAMDDASIGPLGWQNRFGNGAMSIQVNFASATSMSIPIQLPISGIDSFGFTAVPGNLPPSEFNWSIRAGGSIVADGTETLSPVDIARVSVDSTEITAINSAISNAVRTAGPLEHPHTQIYLEIESEAGSFAISALNVRSTPSINLNFDPGNSIVLAINDAIPDSPLTGTTRLVPIPFQFDLPGAISVTIDDVESSSSFTTNSMTFSNISTTITPSYQWMEIHSTHTVTSGFPSEVQIDIAGIENGVTVVMDLTQNTHTISQYGDFIGELLILDPANPYSHTINGDSINSTIRFRINASWDDEPEVRLKSRIILDDGRRSIPKIQLIGIGPREGIENDIMIRTWSIRNDLNVAIPLSESYLKSEADISVIVELGFPQTDSSMAPRSGDARVHLFLNNQEISNTTTFTNGTARFDIQTPATTGEVEYRVELESLHGSEVTYAVTTNRTFVVDSISPDVVGMNINPIDHLEQNPAQTLRFEIFDRPVLPSNVAIMLWREWEDDINGDGIPDGDEYRERPLDIPWNRSHSNGNYSIVLDDRLAPDESLVYGYLIGADPAGNQLLSAGGPGVAQSLFVYQLKSDGAPLLSDNGQFLEPTNGYLHPGTKYHLQIPVFEPNGYADIETAELQLASNSQVDLISINWDGLTRTCSSESANLEYLDCSMLSENDDPLTPFTTNAIFEVEFQLGWSVAGEDELRREPTLELIDYAGQSSWRSYPDLRWRYSPDLAIDGETLLLEPYEGTLSDDGAWMRPNGLMGLNGTVIFPASGSSPSEPFTVAVIFNGIETKIQTDSSGLWSTELRAPTSSGDHPLSFELIELPAQSRDLTDPALTLRWITVDGEEPRPNEIIAPRTSATLPIANLQNLTLEMTINEQGEINRDEITLHWALVKRNDVSRTVAYGTNDVEVMGTSLSGQAIPSLTTFSVTGDIPNSAFMEELDLHIWISGKDRAGNDFTSTSSFNSATSPFAVWQIETLGARFSIEDDIVYSRTGSSEVGEGIIISAQIRNIGEIDGIADVYFIAEKADGTQNKINIDPLEIQIQEGDRATVDIDWTPQIIGSHTILVQLNGEIAASGEIIEIVEPAKQGLLSGDDIGFTVVIGLMFTLLFGILIAVVMIAIRSTGGDDWDEYDEELWDQTDELEIEEARQRDQELNNSKDSNVVSPVTQQSNGDARLTGMDTKTYQYWAQQGYSHEQIVDWWRQANSGN